MKEEQILETQSANQAPPPAFLNTVLNQAKAVPSIPPGSDRDKLLAELSNSDAWKTLKKFIEAKQLMLAQQLREATKERVDAQEVGMRFLIADQVNQFANQIITFVEAPKEIIKLQAEYKK